MRCARTWPSSASLRHKATKASRSCLPSSPTPAMRACPRMRVPAYLHSLRRLPLARPKSGRTRSAFSRSIARMRTASGSRPFPVSVSSARAPLSPRVPDASIFKRGRDFAAWIGIVPREDSTGGKQRLGPISKQGDQYLRRILIVGALAVLRQARAHPEKYHWVTQLLARKPAKVVAVAIANKTARIAWAVLTKKENYRVQTNAVV